MCEQKHYTSKQNVRTIAHRKTSDEQKTIQRERREQEQYERCKTGSSRKPKITSMHSRRKNLSAGQKQSSRLIEVNANTSDTLQRTLLRRRRKQSSRNKWKEENARSATINKLKRRFERIKSTFVARTNLSRPLLRGIRDNKLLEHICIPQVKTSPKGRKYISGGHAILRGEKETPIRGLERIFHFSSSKKDRHNVTENHVTLGGVVAKKTMFPSNKSLSNIVEMADYAFKHKRRFKAAGLKRGRETSDYEGVTRDGITIHFLVNGKGKKAKVATFFPIFGDRNSKKKMKRSNNKQK